MELHKRQLTDDDMPQKKSGFMWLVFALLAALTAAIVVVATKAGLKNVDPALTLALQALFIIVIAWVIVGFEGSLNKITEIDRKGWIFLTIAGVATTLSSYFTYKALDLGEASYVVSIERLSLVLAVLFSVFFLKEKLTWPVIAGMVLMLSGAIIIAVTEKSG